MADIIKNDNNNFSNIISIIEAAKQRAMKAVTKAYIIQKAKVDNHYVIREIIKEIKGV